ncbi:MAG: IS5 family transposase [Acidobacteriota bacterium]|nr:IS5 family transposase [Acidobacteriota bacterium]
MRGGDRIQNAMFSYLSPETRVREGHPLRAIRVMVDRALGEMSPLFDEMYSELGRPSIAPEKLLRAQLLQMLYSVRSERLLMEEIDYRVLFRWFVGMNLDEPVWDVTVFTKNRERLLEHNVGKVFFVQVGQQAEQAKLTSDEHFTVDGTLLEACASLKSFPEKGAARHDDPDDPGNPTVNFHAEKRSNDTHESSTDADSRLARKGRGKEAKLSFCGNLLIENGNGLIANTELLQANGTAEREAALLMIEQIPAGQRVTVGADKGYHTQDFVAECRHLNATPHVSQNSKRPGGSAIDARSTRHAGYKISQQKRKRTEECFGWLKTVALLRKLRHRGIFKVGWIFTFAAAAYNLVRMRKLLFPAVQSA